MVARTFHCLHTFPTQPPKTLCNTHYKIQHMYTGVHSLVACNLFSLGTSSSTILDVDLLSDVRLHSCTFSNLTRTKVYNCMHDSESNNCMYLTFSTALVPELPFQPIYSFSFAEKPHSVRPCMRIFSSTSLLMAN